jgi:hypothetical protein
MHHPKKRKDVKKGTLELKNIQKSQIFIFTQTQNSKNDTKGNLGKISKQT